MSKKHKITPKLITTTESQKAALSLLNNSVSQAQKNLELYIKSILDGHDITNVNVEFTDNFDINILTNEQPEA